MTFNNSSRKLWPGDGAVRKQVGQQLLISMNGFPRTIECPLPALQCNTTQNTAALNDNANRQMKIQILTKTLGKLPAALDMKTSLLRSTRKSKAASLCENGKNGRSSFFVANVYLLSRNGNISLNGLMRAFPPYKSCKQTFRYYVYMPE